MSVYLGVRGGEGEPVPRTYFCRDIAAAEVGGALTKTPLPVLSFFLGLPTGPLRAIRVSQSG